MKKLELKEARAPYNVSLDEALLSDEVVILEKEGQPVAALLPMAEYAAFRAWREAQGQQLKLQSPLTERSRHLRAAAELLSPDYTTDAELRIFTALDGEDFRE